jgi:uncharacterized protein (TIGR02996 family)
MNHEQAFLQAIREAPDDDAPRLIYADWLEEQGGASRAARADFIRIQCRLDELPDDDPARDRLEDEAADIVAEYEAEWIESLHGIAEDWCFSRGFIERIRIRSENLLTHAERLFDFAPLRSLHLLIPRNDVPHLAACPQLRWVSTLDFSRCQLNDRSLQQLLTSPHLERLSALNLFGNDINTPGIEALVHSLVLTQLRSLDLSFNRGLGDRAIRLLAQEKNLASLERLSIAGSNLTFGGMSELLRSTTLLRLSDLDLSWVRLGLAQQTFNLRSLREPPLLRQLQTLDLSNTSALLVHNLLVSPDLAKLRALSVRFLMLRSDDASSLTASPALQNLTRLDLKGNNLGAAGTSTLAAFPNLAPVTYLDLSSNNIRDTGAKALATSPYLARFRFLDLSSNGIGGPGLKALADSTNLNRLRTLHLGSNFIGSDSVRALAESPHLRNLTSLDLSDASLEEDSARALASSANLTRLTTLLLKKNLLGDGGAKALAQSPHLTRLSTLDLNDNRIGKAGAEALAAASWRRMRNLDLRGNVFTDTQEALLRKRFGNAVQL